MKLKKCSKCKIEKSLDKFNKNKNETDGYCWYCKHRNLVYNYLKENGYSELIMLIDNVDKSI